MEVLFPLYVYFIINYTTRTERQFLRVFLLKKTKGVLKNPFANYQEIRIKAVFIRANLTFALSPTTPLVVKMLRKEL